MLLAFCSVLAACADAEGTTDATQAVPAFAVSRTAAPDGACGTSGSVPVISGLSAEALKRLYVSVGYELESIRRGEMGVPRVLVADLPADLDAVSPVEQRKSVFLKTVLPAILFVNERLREQRAFLEGVEARQTDGRVPSAAQSARLAALAECYGTEPGDIAALLGRVDIVPPALGLAQAAIESGWGTSRFAQGGNALLGQRTTGGTGFVPARLEKPGFRVRSFDHILECIAAYAYNLNTHAAYAPFRAERRAIRENGERPDGMALAGTLLRYSERGAEYVADVRDVIRANRLEPLDGARFGKGRRPDAT